MSKLSLEILGGIATAFYNIHMIKNVIFFGTGQSLEDYLSCVQS